MSRRAVLVYSLAWVLCLNLLASSVLAQQPKQPKWTHAFDLSCRKYGEAEFTKDTQKYGVEIFKDPNSGYGVYVSQAGSFAAAPGFETTDAAFAKSQGPKWVAGLDLPSRKAGEQEFTKSTKVFGLEVFLDPNVNNWIYITENGKIATTPLKKGATVSSSNLQAPKWLHSVDLRCRKGGVKEWTDAPKYGIEVYRDNNTGNLIYICETGAIAVLPEGTPTKGDEGKAPLWLHGLDLSVRESSEKDFTQKTRKFGVEVFRDENNGNLIYISETGGIGVLPGKQDLKAPTPNVKEPKWTHGLNLSCRKYGEAEFTEKTTVYGAEIFLDDNTGGLLYVPQTGAISIISAKQ